jgi:hypothetical protein
MPIRGKAKRQSAMVLDRSRKLQATKPYHRDHLSRADRVQEQRYHAVLGRRAIDIRNREALEAIAGADED